jgi:transposase-like protein
MVVERLKACGNIVELSQGLRVHRRLLCKWRDQFDSFGNGEEPPPGNSRESTLRKEVNQLKRVLVDKTLELDVFKQPELLSLLCPWLWDVQRKHGLRNLYRAAARSSASFHPAICRWVVPKD